MRRLVLGRVVTIGGSLIRAVVVAVSYDDSCRQITIVRSPIMGVVLPRPTAVNFNSSSTPASELSPMRDTDTFLRAFTGETRQITA